MKIILYFFLLTAIVVTIYIKYTRMQAQKNFITRIAHIKITPETAVFAFDLHSTILEPNKKEIAQILWHDSRKLKISIFFRMLFWNLAIKLATDKFMIKQAIIELSKQYPDQAEILENMSVKIMCAYTLPHDMLKILQNLKKQGYALYIASSIWEDGYAELIKKYPVLTEIFRGAYISSAQNNYIHKPELAYYLEFEKYLKTQDQQDKNIIFVDNSYINIASVPDKRWYAYQYRNTPEFARILPPEPLAVS